MSLNNWILLNPNGDYEDFKLENPKSKVKETTFNKAKAKSSEKVENDKLVESLEKELAKQETLLQKQRDLNTRLRRVNRNVERDINSVDTIINSLLEQLPKVHFTENNLSKFANYKNNRKKWGIIQLTDIHANTRVLPEEANGNEYNFEVLSKRLDMFITKAIDYFKSFDITNVYLISSGDLFSSTRRADEQLTQITSISNAMLLFVDMMKQVIARLIDNGFTIKITSVVGNESRLNQMDFNFCKTNASENFDWITLNILKSIYSEVDKKVIDILIPQNPLTAIINIPTKKGFNLLVNHGYGLKAVENGALPLLRSVDNLVDKIDLTILGHLHHTSVYNKVCWAGSMIGNNVHSTNAGFSTVASQNLYVIEDDNSYFCIPVMLQNGWQEFKGFDYDKEIANEAYLKKEYGYGNKGPIIILR